jgi:tetratricopeptide (TPR) repeat protein
MGEEVDIEAVCDRFIEQRPEDTEGAILLVRALEELGRKDLADRVYAATMEIKREELEWGRRNSFAWVAGMCGRDLDEALDAAEGNTGLLFGPAAYLDTLAAVYYARGEYRKAVETEARAVAEGRSMTPLLWPFQLARFSAALKASTAD